MSITLDRKAELMEREAPASLLSSNTSTASEAGASRSDLQLREISFSDGSNADSFYELRFKADDSLDLNKFLGERRELSFLSRSIQKDEYILLEKQLLYLPPGLYRLRSEGDKVTSLTRKSHGSGINSPSTTEDTIDPLEGIVSQIRKHGLLLNIVSKTRTTFQPRLFPSCLLHHDNVDGLGAYFDLKGNDPEILKSFREYLGLTEQEAVQKGYFDLSEEKSRSKFEFSIWKFHFKFMDYVLGVVSGSLTSLGILNLALFAMPGRDALTAALLSAAVADGFSDSVASARASQSSERSNKKEMITTFLKTLSGKSLIPMSFLPITFLQSSTAIFWGATLWASILVGGTAAIQAVACKRPVFKEIAGAVGFALGASVLGSLAGRLVQLLG